MRSPRNSRPTPSSSAQPPGSVPSRTLASQTGSRSGSPSAWTVSEPSSRPRPASASGGPLERVTPPWKPAHRAGAEPGEHGAGPPGLHEQAVEPVRAPDGQQVAHRAATDVDDVLPSTISSSGPRASRRWKSERCSGVQCRSAKRARKALICAVVSPEAVGRNSTRGSLAAVSDRTKSSSSGLVGSIVKPPPPIAKIRRCSRPTSGRALTRGPARARRAGARWPRWPPTVAGTVGAAGGRRRTSSRQAAPTREPEGRVFVGSYTEIKYRPSSDVSAT